MYLPCTVRVLLHIWVFFPFFMLVSYDFWFPTFYDILWTSGLFYLLVSFCVYALLLWYYLIIRIWKLLIILLFINSFVFFLLLVLWEFAPYFDCINSLAPVRSTLFSFCTQLCVLPPSPPTSNTPNLWWAHILGCVAFNWSVVSLERTILLRKTDSPPRCY